MDDDNDVVFDDGMMRRVVVMIMMGGEKNIQNRQHHFDGDGHSDDAIVSGIFSSCQNDT